jgi:hypothetical protein
MATSEPTSASGFLSAAERERFATWLEAEAQSDEMMAQEARRLPGVAGLILWEERRQDAAAKRRIAAQLRATESVTL